MDAEDEILFSMFPEVHAQDLTKEPVQKKTPSKKPRKDVPVDALWSPAKPEPNDKQKLISCAKNALLYGGLCSLVFAWQQMGLMDPSVALPSMIACAVLTGLTIGKNAMR